MEPAQPTQAEINELREQLLKKVDEEGSSIPGNAPLSLTLTFWYMLVTVIHTVVLTVVEQLFSIKTTLFEVVCYVKQYSDLCFYVA